MLTATGIGSGIDIESLVTQLVAAERAPAEDRIDRQETTLSSELSSLAYFQSSLASMQDAVSALNDDLIFDTKSVTSSDSAAVSVAVTGDAEANLGSFDISVLQLAQSHTLASTAFTSLDEVVGEGTLTISFGTTDYEGDDPGPESYNSFVVNSELDSLTLEIEAGNNQLDQVRDQINEADAGVSASVVYDGTGYRLVITSNEGGAASSMEITVSDTGDTNHTDAIGLSRLAFSSAATNMEQTRQGLNAEAEINGLAITSSSNTLDEAIEGVSIDLADITESSVTVTVAENRGTLVQRVSSFVSAYNNYMNTVDQVAGYDADLESGGVLQGDFTVRSVTNQLRSLVSSTAPGAIGDYEYFSQVGISTLVTGRLEFDRDIFQDAMDADADSVEALFVDRVAVTDDNIEAFSNPSDTTVDGTWPVTISQIATQAEYLGATLSFPLVIDDDNDNFSLSVDGVSSEAIQLSQGSYADGDELVAMMLSALSSDATLSDANKIPELVYNSTDNRLEFRSNDYGSDTSIEFLTVDTSTLASLGFSLGEGTAGVDVAGYIGEWEATGTGQILRAASDTEVDGLSLKILGGATGDRGEISFSQGLAGLIEQMADRYLIDEGPLTQRSESINNTLENLTEERETLDYRMDLIEARYRSQFNALDSLLASLQTTSDFLTQQLDNLPGARSID